MSETKSPHDFICDGVLAYGVDVGRFVFNSTGKTVYAISGLLHVTASDALMFYQISKLNYKRLMGMSLPHRIPEPPVPASVTGPCRTRFLCGESAYCKRYSFTVFDADSALIEDTVQDQKPEREPRLFRCCKPADPAKPLSPEENRTGQDETGTALPN